MLIRQKVGMCIDCTPADGEKKLMAKRCTEGPHYHYSKFNAKKQQENASKRKKAKIKRISENNNGLTLSQWFSDQISQLPKCCENCDEYLNQYAPWFAHCFVAHIVPKRDFESVMVHPLNRLFLCEKCHHKFDNSLSSEIVTMKCWPLAVERFNTFKHLITPEEIKHLQDCFYDIM